MEYTQDVYLYKAVQTQMQKSFAVSYLCVMFQAISDFIEDTSRTYQSNWFSFPAYRMGRTPLFRWETELEGAADSKHNGNSRIKTQSDRGQGPDWFVVLWVTFSEC